MAVKKEKRGGLVVPEERIVQGILMIRAHKVMQDADLADLCGVTTKRLNEQVKRNQERFPADFMFQLTHEEKAEVVANCDHLARLKFSPDLPNAFTEHGAIMAASVPNTPRAVEMSVSLSAPSSGCGRGLRPMPNSHASSRRWKGSTTPSSKSCLKPSGNL